MATLPIEVRRLHAATPDALHLLEEYYESIGVLVRDTPETIASLCRDSHSGLWLAYKNSEAVGCVILRPLPQIPSAAECKRLYVRPSARGHHIAHQLMDALELHATHSGLHAIYLDSKDDLHAAITLYRKRGYIDCPRYNDNPQATIFLRKPLQAHTESR